MESAESIIAKYYGSLTKNANDKLNWWTNKIETDSIEKKQPEFCLKELKERFTLNSVTPKALARVLQHLQEQQSIIAKDIYVNDNGTWVNWLWSFLLAKGDPEDENQPWISIPVVKHLSTAVFQNVTSNSLYNTDRIFLLDDLRERCPYIDLLIPQLRRERKINTFDYYGKVGVKFCDHKGVVSITEADKGIVTILKTLKTLQDQEADLVMRVKRLKSDIKDCLSQGQRSKAKGFLKRRKLLLSVQEKRSASIQNIQGILDAIQNAETDRDVLSAYQAGVVGLREAKGDVTAEKIDDAMLELSDVLADQSDIDNAYAAGADLVGVSESEVEAELEALIAESRQPQRAPITTEEKKERLQNDFAALVRNLSESTPNAEPEPVLEPQILKPITQQERQQTEKELKEIEENAQLLRELEALSVASKPKQLEKKREAVAS